MLQNLEDRMKTGDYIIVQRQSYTKLHKLKQNGTINLGNMIIELNNALDERFSETFQMKLKDGSNRLYTLEKKEIPADAIKDLTTDSTSGVDNRDLNSDNTSQTLTTTELSRLRDEQLASGTEMLDKLMQNSKTFTKKTGYSQEKYLKKKEKKYFDFVILRKPSIRILAQMFYRQDPSKTLGMRIEDVSQLVTYANVQSEGDYMLYDSGTSGLISATILERMGAKTRARLIHAHPGNECQKAAVLAMQFPQEQFERCINVNIYSVLRCYYQNNPCKLKHTENEIENIDREDTKIVHANICNNILTELTQLESEPDNNIDEAPPDPKKRKIENNLESSQSANIGLKQPKWQLDNEAGCTILNSGIDSLVIVSKEHPQTIVDAFAPFLRKSRPLVVFNTIKEPLQDLYVHLKTKGIWIDVQLSGNFVRDYQVLPDRTHPMMNMQLGGYILRAFKVSDV